MRSLPLCVDAPVLTRPHLRVSERARLLPSHKYVPIYGERSPEFDRALNQIVYDDVVSPCLGVSCCINFEEMNSYILRRQMALLDFVRLLMLLKQKYARHRRYGVRPIFQRRIAQGDGHNLRFDSALFFNYTR